MSLPRDGRRSLGAAGERLAATYLEARGYEIIARNVRLRNGEIDLIARHGSTLVLIEVRVRRGAPAGAALESISRAKQRRLRRLAGEYCAHVETAVDAVRIDVVGVSLDRTGLLTDITLVQNAVEGE